MAKSSDDQFVTSAVSRFLELGGLVARVGISVAGNQTANLLRSAENAARQSTEVWRKSALLVAARLGELKGAAMKAGQMLSLYEGLFPPEFTQILESLQKDAPAVSFDKMEARVRRELGASYDLFELIEPVAHASASIGQLHRARLRDGRDVVVKIQYPDIDQVIRSDLKNLKVLLKSLFGLFTKVDLDPHWEELQARLLEELDYREEARSLERMAALHADWPDLVIPATIPELCTAGILTLTYEPGMGAAEIAAPEIPRALHDKWGRVLFDLMCRNLYQHHYIHADPNLGNYGFREDGRVVLYDFGCMKEVPEYLHKAYAAIGRALLDDEDGARLGTILADMGIRRTTGEPIDPEVLGVIFDSVKAPFRGGDDYAFGTDNIFDAIIDLKQKYWSQAMDMEAPPDIIFMDRTFAGTYGNLSRLKARGPWRDLLEEYISAYEARTAPAAV